MPPRRTRRTSAQKAELKAQLVSLAQDHAPATVRQVFYLAVSAGLIPKVENTYKNVVIPYLSQARLDGELGWHAIADHSRSVYSPETFDSLSEALESTAHTYRRALWSESPHRVEVWCEKQTLVGALDVVTNIYDVGLFPTRGYPSLTYLHDAAQEHTRPTRIFYFGDLDPSGEDIQRNLTERLDQFGSDCTVQRIAVTRDQVAELDLALRPTKTTDTRAKGFQGGSVEVEAIPPVTLRKLCRDAIEGAIHDRDAWRRLQEVEEAEQRTLADIVSWETEELLQRYGHA